MITKDQLKIGGEQFLTLEDCISFVQNNMNVLIDESAVARINQSHKILIETLKKRHIVYGVNTNFGDQANCVINNLSHISHDDYQIQIEQRQDNLIQSHACGQGPVMPLKFTRLAMMLRAHCLSRGYSGITPDVLQDYLAFINAGILPNVYQYGSIGASGDLIPMANIMHAFTGSNVTVTYQNEEIPASEAISRAEINIPKLQCKDGLSLINGTSYMSAIAATGIYELSLTFKQMLNAIAMITEAMRIYDCAYDPHVHQLKNHQGQIKINEILGEFWHDSQLLIGIDDYRKDYLTVDKKDNILFSLKPPQDYYSLRSIAQGFGPFCENLDKAIKDIENEINSVNDNPVIDINNQAVLHCANFMGYYVTDSCDLLKNNIAQASSWIHALLAIILHPRKNMGLPTNLIVDFNTYSGFRPLQLLACSIAVQNRKLATCTQSCMIPTEGDNQDVNSLGFHAALDLNEAGENLRHLSAILFFAAAQALELRGINNASTNAQKLHAKIRSEVPFVVCDRNFTPDIQNINRMIAQKQLLC